MAEKYFLRIGSRKKVSDSVGQRSGSAHYTLVLVPWKNSNTILRQLWTVFLEPILKKIFTFFDTFWRPCGQLFPNILLTFWRIFCHFFVNILRKIWWHLDQIGGQFQCYFNAKNQSAGRTFWWIFGHFSADFFTKSGQHFARISATF